MFGLVMEEDTDEEEYGGARAEFYPDGLGFNEPWNGCYDT